MNVLNMACTSPLAAILYSCRILGVSLALLRVHGTQGIALATPGFWILSSVRNEGGDA